MANRTRPTLEKRAKERARQEKRKQKEERRANAKVQRSGALDRTVRTTLTSPASCPDRNLIPGETTSSSWTRLCRPFSRFTPAAGPHRFPRTSRRGPPVHSNVAMWSSCRIWPSPSKLRMPPLFSADSLVEQERELRSGDRARRRDDARRRASSSGYGG